MKKYFFFVLAIAFASINAQETLDVAQICNEPSGIQIQRLGDNDGLISADDLSAAYDIYVKPTGANPPSPNDLQSPRNLNDLTFPFTSNILYPQFDYDLWVRTDCDLDGMSSWVGPYLVESYETCDNPMNVMVNRDGATSASFSADDASHPYDILVVMDGATGPGTTDWFVETSEEDLMSGSSFMLDADENYDVYIRKQCNVSQVSEWVGPYDLDAYCPAPVEADIVLTRTSDTTAEFDGANPNFTYQGTANLSGRPLRDRPMYGMINMSLPWTQNGLISSFEYDVWFRTECPDGETFSDWVGPLYLPLYESGNCEEPQDFYVEWDFGDLDTLIIPNYDPSAVYDIMIYNPLINVDTEYILFDNVSLNTDGTFTLSFSDTSSLLESIFPNFDDEINDYLTTDYYIRKDCGDSQSDWVQANGGTQQGVTAKNITSRRGVKQVLNISPNPTKGLIKIEGMKAVSAQVMNITGKAELSTKVVNNELNVSNLAPGQYILNVTDAKGNVQSLQFIKK